MFEKLERRAFYLEVYFFNSCMKIGASEVLKPYFLNCHMHLKEFIELLLELFHQVLYCPHRVLAKTLESQRLRIYSANHVRGI